MCFLAMHALSKKLTPSQIQGAGISSTGPKAGLTCGDNGDCIGCPLDERVTDGCQPYPPWTTALGDKKPGMFDSPCYGNILKKKIWMFGVVDEQFH